MAAPYTEVSRDILSRNAGAEPRHVARPGRDRRRLRGPSSLAAVAVLLVDLSSFADVHAGGAVPALSALESVDEAVVAADVYPAPSGLRAVRYGPSSGGIAWDRDTGTATVLYRVSRDGMTVLDDTPNTSYIDDALVPGQAYRYEVIATNEGEALAGAIAMPASGRDDEPESPGDGSGEPEGGTVGQPTGLRSIRYSDTAGAIAWDRAETPGVRYEISRDGVVVLASTTATSYVDGTLRSGIRAVYGVAAISPNGARSRASTVELLDTPGAASSREPRSPGDGPSLADSASEVIAASALYENESTLVPRVTAIAEAIVAGELSVRPLADGRLPFRGRGFEGTFDGEPVPATVLGYDCPLGGTLSVARATQRPNDIERYRGTAYRFDACRLADGDGESIVSGELTTLRYEAGGPGFGAQLDTDLWNDVELTGLDGFAIDGTVEFGENSGNGVGAEGGRTVELSGYRRGDGDAASERLGDISFALRIRLFGGGGTESSLRLSGTVENEDTGGAAVSIETVAPFVRREVGTPEVPNPFTGEIVLRAEDGRSVTLTGRPTPTRDPFVDLRSVEADGTVDDRENVPFVSLPVKAEEAPEER